MSYLLDTDWVISFLNGKANAVELVSRIADEGVALSIVTCGEIYEGLLGSQFQERQTAEFGKLIDSVDLITPTIAVAREYAIARSRLRSQGLLVPDNDIWIAATALAHDLVLVSRDQHFPRIPDLKLYQSE